MNPSIDRPWSIGPHWGIDSLCESARQARIHVESCQEKRRLLDPQSADPLAARSSAREPHASHDATQREAQPFRLGGRPAPSPGGGSVPGVSPPPAPKEGPGGGATGGRTACPRPAPPPQPIQPI